MSKHVPKFAECVIDVGGGAKFTGESGEFVSDAIGFEDAALFARVEKTESWMRVVAKHGAAAIVGSAVRTPIGIAAAR